LVVARKKEREWSRESGRERERERERQQEIPSSAAAVDSDVKIRIGGPWSHPYYRTTTLPASDGGTRTQGGPETLRLILTTLPPPQLRSLRSLFTV